MKESHISHIGSEQNLFPVIMGNEEETGMQVRIEDDPWQEPELMLENLRCFIPTDLRGRKDFLSNGFKMYLGGSSNDTYTNLERATPECTSPQDVSLYIRAGELILTALSRNYAEQHSEKYDVPVDVRLQRRVVDSIGNRKGCHDNYGYRYETHFVPNPPDLMPNSLLAYLATRSFISGAGLITPNTTRYSQKIDGLSREFGYGYFGSMYRISHEEPDYPRIETRCNDINISEWATTVRIGGAALLLAMLQTPLKGELERRSSDLLNYHFSAIDLAKSVNGLNIDRDGTVKASPDQLRALGYQHYVAEEALVKLQLYTDVPDDYYGIAREIYDYCDDYKAVIEGRKDFTDLANRSDWAAKLTRVLNKLDKNLSYGSEEDMNGITAQAEDLKYDYMRISAEDGSVANEFHGSGYRLRDRGKFDKFQHTEKEVKQAYKNAPADTRASLRSKILKSYQVDGCDWKYISIFDGADQSSIRLDPLQTEMSEEDIWRLSEAKELADKIDRLFAL